MTEAIAPPWRKKSPPCAPASKCWFYRGDAADCRGLMTPLSPHGPSPAASAAQASASMGGSSMGLPVLRLVPVRQSCTVDGATPSRSAAARTERPMLDCQARKSEGWETVD